ncbi:MAG: hypothetical protein AAB845_03645 [Patescibacteria group bacterium]
MGYLFFRDKLTLSLFLGLFFLVSFLAVDAESTSSAKNIFVDSDQDNLSLDEEKLYGTNPDKADTDGDGYSDGVEVESGYNPLLPAPGDRIVAGDEEKRKTTTELNESGPNLTNEVSQQISGVLSTIDSENKEITFDQINGAVEQALSSQSTEITLPEVDVKSIKIKKAPSSSLKEKERIAQERKDVLEYLTVMSYIVVDNSPAQFSNEDEFGGMLGNLSNQAVLTLASGNKDFTNTLAERGQKILDESQKLEVPEAMLDIHIKALKMGLYAVSLKQEINPASDDPLGQIAVLSRLQGLLGVSTQFVSEVQGALEKYEIVDIPLEL